MAHAVVFAEHTVKGMRDPWYIDEHSGAEYVKTWSDALRILDDGTPKKVMLYQRRVSRCSITPNAKCQKGITAKGTANQASAFRRRTKRQATWRQRKYHFQSVSPAAFRASRLQTKRKRVGFRLFAYNRKAGERAETRVALISIIVENSESTAQLNALLHDAGQYIIGRMGLPYRAKGVSIISVVLDAPQDVISALAGRIGRLPGVSAKTAYSNRFPPAGD